MIKTPIVAIQADGLDLTPDNIRRVLRVSLKLQERKADTGEILFHDPDQQILDSRVFRKGATLSFVLGWTDEFEAKGPYIVKSYKPTLPEGGNGQLKVVFQDSSHNMNRQQRRRRFANQTPAQVIEQIAREYNLDYDIESIQGVSFSDDLPLIQANVTDARLLQRLADRYGYVWGISDGVLYFRRPVDLDELGQQNQVKTLSYRINDWSLKSFSPEFKFTSGRRRRGANQRSSNVDLLNGTAQNNGLFDVTQTRQSLNSVSPELAGIVATLTGQTADDDETDTQTTSAGTGEGRGTSDRVGGYFSPDNIRQEFGRLISVSPNSRQQNEESEPGDTSGSATPDTEQAANREAGGRVVRASEIIEGQAIPSIASITYKPGDAVILAGVGERLSGRYKIVEVDHSVSEQAFETKLKLKKYNIMPSQQSQQQIAQASDDAASGSDGTSSTGQPPQQRMDFVPDPVGQRLGPRVARVDGQE